VPGYSHYNFITSPEAPQIIRKFLDDPLTNPPAGAAAASQVAPAPEKTTSSASSRARVICSQEIAHPFFFTAI